MTPLEKYKSFRRLFLGQTRKEVIYLGYALEVTKREYDILRLLLDEQSHALTPEQIAALLGGNVTEKNIAYHIFNLNKKSKSLGNREIIKNKAKIGYFLNEEM